MKKPKRYKLQRKEKENIFLVLEAIGKIRAKFDKDNQDSGTIICPLCNNTLYYTIARSNMHIWGKCETNSCLSWMM